MTTPDKSEPRVFPGGRVRLPKLTGTGARADAVHEPHVQVVGTAFIREAKQQDPTDVSSSAFTRYFTTESLFEEPVENEESKRIRTPHEVLGLRESATWKDVQIAHRTLVKEFHPDRFSDQDISIIAQAETETKLINAAYSELRNRRSRGEF